MPLAVVVDDRVDVWEVPSQPHILQVRMQMLGGPGMQVVGLLQTDLICKAAIAT